MDEEELHEIDKKKRRSQLLKQRRNSNLSKPKLPFPINAGDANKIIREKTETVFTPTTLDTMEDQIKKQMEALKEQNDENIDKNDNSFGAKQVNASKLLRINSVMKWPEE